MNSEDLQRQIDERCPCFSKPLSECDCEKMRPIIVCLCGSTRFGEAFQRANLEETLTGKIVLTVGCMTQSDEDLKELITPDVKTMLDELHKRKIDLADEVLILNVGGYIGESTSRELAYATKMGKKIRFLEVNNGN